MTKMNRVRLGMSLLAATSVATTAARGNSRGFLYEGGTFTTISVPGAPKTWTNGINDSGLIVGSYFDNPSGPAKGFLYAGGAFTTFGVLQGFFTEARGINGSGQAVGDYGGSGPSSSFVYSGGVSTTFSLPGCVNTQAFGINDSGQIAGICELGRFFI